MALRKWRHHLWQHRHVLTIAPSVAGVVILLRAIGLFQAWEWAAYDQYMRLRPAMPVDERVVIVGITEADVSEIGQAIVPDGVYAQVLEKLRSQSPRAIGLDIYRDLPVEPGHDELIKIFETTPNLIGIQKVVGTAGRQTVSPPPALAALGQVGANDLIIDADNTVRRGLLSTQTAEGTTAYSLSLYLSLLYLEAEGIGPKMVDEDIWWLGKTLFEPFEASDGGYVRADANGYQHIINYRGGDRSFIQVSLLDVLNDSLPADWATDRIVLIGAVGDSFQDTVYTPYSSTLLSIPEPMSGVEVHASLTSQIVSAALDGQTQIRSWPEAFEWLWILAWSGAGASFVWCSRRAGRRWQKRGFAIAILTVLFGGTYTLFCFGWWVPIVPAMLAMAGSAVASTAQLARSASNIRRTFGRYLSDEIVTTLLENPEGQKLGGERRKITILTSDLRGFTAAAEQLAPEVVVKVLNFYLGEMAQVIARYKGTIDEYMGDGILVLFGAPIQREDDATRAIACAVDMQLAMEYVNKTMQSWHLTPLDMGIGVHTGEVIVGNIGSEQRSKYGVVGSPVNLTYRIESVTVGGQVLISDETLQAAGEGIQTINQQTIVPKGIVRPVVVHEVMGIGPPYNLHLTKAIESFSTLAVPLPIRLRYVKDKQISAGSFVGQIVALSEKGALFKTEESAARTIETLSNLKINFLSLGSAEASQDTYAKVIAKDERQYRLHIHFTALPEAIAYQLKVLRVQVLKL